MIATLERLPVPRTEDWPYLTDPDFAGEKPGAQEEVRHWWPIMEAIAAAPDTMTAIRAQARANHHSEYLVKRMYYGTPQKPGWAKTRHYGALVNRSKYPDPRDASLPSAFVEFLCTRHDANQRVMAGKRAIDAVMAAFAAWERDPHNPDLAIPGFDTPPRRNALTGHPDGWSQDSLYRVLRERGNARNPGATADLIAACLFAMLRQGDIALPLQIPWTRPDLFQDG